MQRRFQFFDKKESSQADMLLLEYKLSQEGKKEAALKSRN